MGLVGEAVAGEAVAAGRGAVGRLLLTFLRRLLALHLELVDEVERELGAKARRRVGQTR